MTLKDIIKIADKAYPDGLVKACFKDPTHDGGDTLAKFIALETKDVYERSQPAEYQINMVAGALDRAARELDAVVKTLLTKRREILAAKSK